MLKNLNDLIFKAKKALPKRLVVVSANDEYVINAVNEAQKLGIIKPILIGPQNEIKDIIFKKGLDHNQYQIIDSSSDEEASYHALTLIKNKEADILMKGLLDTKVLLKAVVNKELGIRDANLLSHVGLVSFSDYDRVLYVTDGAMNITPSVSEKINIIENAVKLTSALGYDNTKVGLVAAVEKVNPKMPSTVDADEVVKKIKQNPIKNCLVDGPFAIDNLVSKESALHKGISSEVAGNVDVLVFPTIDSGNVFYKTSVFLGKAESAGIVIGAKCPIVLTSRADSSLSKLYSIALAVVYEDGLSTVNN